MLFDNRLHVIEVIMGDRQPRHRPTGRHTIQLFGALPDRPLEQWIERLQPKRAILTHMTTELDYDSLRRSLPENFEPAYDGMTIEFDGRFG